jgi:hypothetical protein
MVRICVQLFFCILSTLLLISCSNATEKKEVVKSKVERNPDLFADYIKTGDISSVQNYISSFKNLDINKECLTSKEKIFCIDLAVINKEPEMIDYIFKNTDNKHMDYILNLIISTRDLPTIEYIFPIYGGNKLEPLKKVIENKDLEVLNIILKNYDNKFNERDSMLLLAREIGDKKIITMLSNQFNNGIIPIVKVWPEETVYDLEQEMDLDNDGIKEIVKLHQEDEDDDGYEDDYIIEVIEGNESFRTTISQEYGTVYFEDLNKDGITEISVTYTAGSGGYEYFDVFHYKNNKILKIGGGQGQFSDIQYNKLTDKAIITDKDEGYYDPETEVDNAVPQSLINLQDYLSNTVNLIGEWNFRANEIGEAYEMDLGSGKRIIASTSNNQINQVTVSLIVKQGAGKDNYADYLDAVQKTMEFFISENNGEEVSKALIDEALNIANKNGGYGQKEQYFNNAHIIFTCDFAQLGIVAAVINPK